MSADPGMWRERLILDADAVTETQLADKVPEGERWFVLRIVALNNTTLGANVKVYVTGGAADMTLDFLRSLEINEEEAVDLGIWLREGEQLGFDWTGVVSGDRLTVTIHGVKSLRGGTHDAGVNDV